MGIHYQDAEVALYWGDWVEVLRTLPACFVQCVVTSPPYWGLRDYGVPGQLGLEATPREYVARLVEGMREVRRVLKPKGVLWLNLGDSYNTRPNGSIGASTLEGSRVNHAEYRRAHTGRSKGAAMGEGLKHKDLVGIPWRVAFALQEDGWWLRSDCIWHKPNPMPESVADRPTRAHEYVFLLTASERYYYDADAVREPMVAGSNRSTFTKGKTHQAASNRRPVGQGERVDNPLGRNLRSVWTVASQPYKGAHFATMPPELARTCIRAGSRPGDTVLDPFSGACTTGMVALQEGRRHVGIELNPEYLHLSTERLKERAPQRHLFAQGE